MSIQAVAWALEQRIPAGPKLVLVALANHADHTSGLCWPSVALIAHEASCSPRAVYRFVADLTRNGYVSVQKKRGKDGKQRSNNYWLTFDRLPLPWAAVPPTSPQDADESNAEDQEIASSDSHEDEPGDSLSPGQMNGAEAPENTMTPGVNASPGDRESPGPSDSAVTRQESSLEPSSVEPSRPSPLRVPAVPHGYDRRARPSAQASAAAEEARRRSQPVFVIEGTRAYEEWAKRKRHEHGHPWHLITTSIVDGKTRRGWWFPSLFPPSASGTDPPNTLTEQDARELMKF
jgi:hypothetical protein